MPRRNRLVRMRRRPRGELDGRTHLRNELCGGEGAGVLIVHHHESKHGVRLALRARVELFSLPPRPARTASLPSPHPHRQETGHERASENPKQDVSADQKERGASLDVAEGHATTHLDAQHNATRKQTQLWRSQGRVA